MEALWGVAVLLAYSGGMVTLGFILGRKTQTLTIKHQSPATVTRLEGERPEGYCRCGHSVVYHSDKEDRLNPGCKAIIPKANLFGREYACRCAMPRQEIDEW